MTELFGLDQELTLEDLDKETFNTHLYKKLLLFLFFLSIIHIIFYLLLQNLFINFCFYFA